MLLTRYYINQNPSVDASNHARVEATVFIILWRSLPIRHCCSVVQHPLNVFLYNMQRASTSKRVWKRYTTHLDHLQSYTEIILFAPARKGSLLCWIPGQGVKLAFFIAPIATLASLQHPVVVNTIWRGRYELAVWFGGLAFLNAFRASSIGEDISVSWGRPIKEVDPLSIRGGSVMEVSSTSGRLRVGVCYVSCLSTHIEPCLGVRDNICTPLTARLWFPT